MDGPKVALLALVLRSKEVECETGKHGETMAEPVCPPI
jgi:hypothetical protein